MNTEQASASPVTIRQAVLADLESLTTLFDRYRQFYGRSSDPGAARAFLLERFDHGESVLLIAHDGAAALGFTQLYPIFSSVSMRRKFVLNDLFVAEEGRRRGVGKGLIEAAARYAAAVGAIGLQLSTATANADAQALYQATGWEREDDYVTFNLALPQLIA